VLCYKKIKYLLPHFFIKWGRGASNKKYWRWDEHLWFVRKGILAEV